eukprot:766948-Pleurochrysis_carterae.AAC.1
MAISTMPERVREHLGVAHADEYGSYGRRALKHVALQSEREKQKRGTAVKRPACSKLRLKAIRDRCGAG